MNCQKCGVPLKRILPIALRISYPHVCIPRPIATETRAFRSPAADTIYGALGVGPEWSQTIYGDYYAKSVPVYAAIRIRAENVCRPSLIVYRRTDDADGKEPVGDDHPLQVLLTKVNDFWTRGDLWRATSTYLDLWGTAYWLLKKAGPDSEPTEIWPLRPDRMRIVPDPTNYIARFEYQTPIGRTVSYRVDEIIWFRQFNPLDEFAGLSPIAPVRLSADMGIEALRHNNAAFKNGMLWGNVGLTMEAGAAQWTEEQVNDFYDRLKKRFASTANSWKPPILSNMKPIQMGFTQRDMEFIESLRWSVNDVVRVYGVPRPMLGDMQDATFSNMDASERIFWRQTMTSLLMFLQEEINEMLVPQFNDPALFCEFDLSQIGALQEDRDKLELREREDVKLGIQTINEVREGRGMEPVPWGDEPRPVALPGLPQGTGEEAMAEVGAPRMFEVSGNHGWRMYRRNWSDHAIDTITLGHVRLLSRNEKHFLVMQRSLFDEQRNDLLRRLKTSRSIRSVHIREFGDMVFNIAEWTQRFLKRGGPLFQLTLIESAERQIATFRLPSAFNPNADGVRAWLKDRTEFWATRVNEETAKLLAEEIEDAIANGEGIPQIQSRVERIFKFSDAVRSEMIARTETQTAANHGALEAYRQSNVVEAKMWLATLDDRTREHHLEAHRQVVSLEAKFEVGGELVDGPGDGSARNVINCRCTLAPVLPDTKALPKQSVETGETNGPGRTRS